MPAGSTVIVGALELHGAEHTLDLLAAAPSIARLLSTRTRKAASHLIGKVRIKTLRHCLASQLENLLSNRDFQRLKIQGFHRLAPYQDFNFLNDVDGQQIGEEVFF